MVSARTPCLHGGLSRFAPRQPLRITVLCTNDVASAALLDVLHGPGDLPEGARPMCQWAVGKPPAALARGDGLVAPDTLSHTLS